MISGANEEELELAEARMDIMLATNYTTENPGPLAIIDKYHDKEIERLNNIIDELEKWLEEQREFIQTIDMMPNLKEIKLEHKIMFNDYNNVLDKLKELKEGK